MVQADVAARQGILATCFGEQKEKGDDHPYRKYTVFKNLPPSKGQNQKKGDGVVLEYVMGFSLGLYFPLFIASIVLIKGLNGQG